MGHGGAQGGSAAGAPPVEKFRKDYAALPYSIDSVDLDFNVQTDETLVTSTLKLTPKGGGPLVLDGEDLRLVSAEVDGKELPKDAYELGEETFTLHNPPSSSFTLKTVVGIEPAKNTQLSGLYESSGNLCTQCEAEGFRRITYFYDRPDCMSAFTCRVEADKKKFPILLSNGNEVGRGDLGDRHWASFEDPFLKPSYLFALVAGDLGGIQGTFTTKSGRDVDLRIWSEHRNCNQLDWSLESLKRAMKWDEETYGLEYDLDVYHVVAVEDFNMGAMENKGLNVFNTACVLAAPQTATDGDYDRVLGVVAHEYFHNWSGNRVTCRDWFQLTLKEGLTVYRDQTFTEDQTSRAVKRIDDVRVMRSAQFAQDAGPMAHPIRPESYVAMDNFYTVTVYNKGADVIRMYATLLGWEGFRKGMDLYFERHDGSAVTCDDFRSAMADANSVDLTQFERWYTQAGTPTVELSDKKVADGTFSLTLSQSCADTPNQPASEKQPFHIPVSCALFEKKTGKKVDEQLFELREASSVFSFSSPVSGSPDDYVVSLLRGFSAPVTAKQELTQDELLFLASNDDDSLNRWDAAQQIYTRAILDEFTSEASKQASLDAAVATFRAALNDSGGDPSLRALNLAVPGFSELGLKLDDGFDPVKLCEALSSVKKALAKACTTELTEVYASLYSDAPYDVEAASVGRRRLRNACLANLARAGGFEQQSVKHYEDAQCMTDQLAAAVALAGEATKEREEVLGKFYESAGNELVVNKWFALQASADADDALETVKKLVAHEAFSRTNPNRYRAVVNTFAGANPRAFHAADGSGYAFIRDEVIQTDKTNNQVAARLCGSFGTWKKYDPARGALMKACLEEIFKTEGLSKDTFEIATRSLK
jgi:aminopeptidase N